MAPSDVILDNVRVFEGYSFSEPRSVALSGGKIGSLKNAQVGDSSRHVDCKGRFLLPGLIESVRCFLIQYLQKRKLLAKQPLTHIMIACTSKKHERPRSVPKQRRHDSHAPWRTQCTRDKYSQRSAWLTGALYRRDPSHSSQHAARKDAWIEHQSRADLDSVRSR